MDTNSNSEIRQGLLIEDSSDIPDISIDSSPSFDNSPSRIAHHRSRYRWKTSHAGIQIQNLDRPFNDGADVQDAMDESSVPSSSGIPIGSAGKGATSTHTGSVSSKQNLSTPNSNDALLSHISSRSASREFAFQDRDPAHLRGSPSLDPSGYELKPWSTHQSFATNQNAEENIGQPRNGKSYCLAKL